MKTIKPETLATIQGGLRARSFHAVGPYGGQVHAVQVGGPFGRAGAVTVTSPSGSTRAFAYRRWF